MEVSRRRKRFARVLCAACIVTLTAYPSAPSAGDASPAQSTVVASTQRVAIIAKAGAFDPPEVHLVQGVPAVLEFTRVVDSSCMNAVRMPWMEKAVDLPLNEKVEVAVDTSLTGVFYYSCWMDMVSGKVVIDHAH